MKYLGIDYGSKRIGSAVSDQEAKMAFPREVVDNVGEKTLQYIVNLITEAGLAGIVIGKSLDFNGKPNMIQPEIEKFKQALERATGVPVHYQTEVLTSAEAARFTEGRMLDASAAAIILQSFLDAL